MARSPLNINPESLRGKLYLLAFDKLVLGSMIAIALFVYKRWETNDQRAYEDRTTLSFQRAGYIKDLMPIVVEPGRDLSARSQALIALIDTGSISDKSALGLTGVLLRQGLVRSDYPEGLVWNRDHPLLDALATRMPSAFEPLLNYYRVSSARDARHPDVNDIEEFWSELFLRAVEQYGESELDLLNNDEFLSRYLFVMDRLVARPLAQDKAKAWFTRGPKGLRILAALRNVGEVGMEQHASGRRYLLALLSPSHLTPDSLSLAGAVIRLQLERQWVSKALATRCLEIVLRSDEDMRATPDYYHRSLPSSSYVQWYASSRRDAASTPFAAGDGGDGWKEIEPAIVAGLRRYLTGISNEKVEASDFGPVVKRNSIALPLVRILLDGIESGESPSEDTINLLREVISLDDEELGALLLDRIDFRQRASKALAR